MYIIKCCYIQCFSFIYILIHLSFFSILFPEKNAISDHYSSFQPKFTIVVRFLSILQQLAGKKKHVYFLETVLFQPSVKYDFLDSSGLQTICTHIGGSKGVAIILCNAFRGWKGVIYIYILTLRFGALLIFIFIISPPICYHTHRDDNTYSTLFTVCVKFLNKKYNVRNN